MQDLLIDISSPCPSTLGCIQIIYRKEIPKLEKKPTLLYIHLPAQSAVQLRWISPNRQSQLRCRLHQGLSAAPCWTRLCHMQHHHFQTYAADDVSLGQAPK